MPDKSSNGSTISFGGSELAGVESIQMQDGGQMIDISDLSTSRIEYLAGQADMTLTINFKGAAMGGLARGDEGDVSIAFNDGTNVTAADCIVGETSQSASKDQPLTSSVTIRYGETTGS
jgi:hypothetical protein